MNQSGDIEHNLAVIAAAIIGLVGLGFTGFAVWAVLKIMSHCGVI